MQLEELRRKRLDELAGLIQKTFRGWSARRFYLRQRACAIRIVRAWKQYKVIRRAVIIIITALSRIAELSVMCVGMTCVSESRTDGQTRINPQNPAFFCCWVMIVVTIKCGLQLRHST